MTPEDAIDTILDIFKAAWDQTGCPMVFDDNVANIPPSETAWARATIKHATGDQSSLSGETGARRFTDTGTITVQVFAPVGDGSTECYRKAQLVRNAYRDAKDPHVWFRNARLKEIGASGAFEQINVLVTFSYDDVR